jgi:hypothetical protein
MKNMIFIVQGVMQIFVGLGAAVSGMLLILYPSGELLQAPLDMLKGSPFQNFLLPGIILFLVNGVGQFIAGVITFRRHRLAGYVGAVFGFALMIWIFVQVNMIGGGHILQYSYFFFGVAETALSFEIQNNLRSTGQTPGPATKSGL